MNYPESGRLKSLILLLLLWFISGLVSGQQTLEEVKAFLKSHQNTIGISTSDFQETEIKDQYRSGHLQLDHIYLQQKFRDIPVHNGILSLHARGGQLISFTNRFITGIAERTGFHLPSVSPTQALNRAGSHLGKNEIPGVVAKEQAYNRLGQISKVIFDKGEWSKRDIEVSLCWMRSDRKEVKLCWTVEIYDQDQESYWLVFIDAIQGQVLALQDLVLHCAFHRNLNDDIGHACHSRSLSEITMADSSYRVFAIPVESPNHGSRTLEVSPWNAAGPGDPATSLGWHHDGSTGYIITRGNNVYAYEDRDANDLPGFSPSSANLQFDFPFDPLLPPADNEEAAITNLFYWNNLVHDLLYQYGFDEVAGNFQADNLGRGGLGGDHVLAEAQDGEDTNNANFLTLPDGNNGVMQMFLWSPVPLTSPFQVNSPSEIAGSYFALESDFSTNNKLDDVGAVTGDLILVQDQSGGTHEACNTNPINNGGQLPGKIAVIDRGNCDFVEKVKNAQDFGAIAVLMINNVPGEPIAMGGTDNTITIPALMISQEDGMIIKDSLEAGSTVNVTFMPVPLITPDGDFDNGIIVHEYGHGVSIRLTGGPSTASCLNNDEQMGEGWSDFLGLMLTTDWSTAMATDKRGIGTYSIGSPTDGTGIRTYPYSTDISVNPFTYADVADAPIIQGQVSPHFVGSVWATMLWEMTWEIIGITAADPDMYHGNGGNNIALQLVVDGMKLQPCNPGFEDGRDAILLADELLYNGKYKCAIWEAFSKRGLGVGARQNSSDDHTDGVEAFDVPSGVRVEHHVAEPVGEGAEVTVDVHAICECIDQTNIKIRDVLPSSLEFVSSNQGTLLGDSVCFDLPLLNAQDTAFLSFTSWMAPCQVQSDSIFSSEDVEGTDQYTGSKLAGTGNKNWFKSSALSNSPTNSWYAQDYSSLADVVLTLDNSLNDEGEIEIGFYHRYETEASFDGGVVELSVDNGATWIDAGPYFTLNGYPSTISTAFTNSPIAGQPAFTGNSDDQFETTDFVYSTLSYCISSQDELLIRFRFVCDGAVAGTGINGWFIDDILIERKASVVIESQLEISSQPVDTTLVCFRVQPFDGLATYVDPTASGTGTGQNWQDAFLDLAPALTLAGCRAIDSVHVAEGLYYPTKGTDPTISFLIPDSTTVYGGYPSGGGNIFQRDPEVHLTVMSGDIGLQGIETDNTHYVLKIQPGQLGIQISGLQIKDANPSGPVMGTIGAPLLAEGEIVLHEVMIINNQ